MYIGLDFPNKTPSDTFRLNEAQNTPSPFFLRSFLLSTFCIINKKPLSCHNLLLGTLLPTEVQREASIMIHHLWHGRWEASHIYSSTRQQSDLESPCDTATVSVFGVQCTHSWFERAVCQTIVPSCCFTVSSISISAVMSMEWRNPRLFYLILLWYIQALTHHHWHENVKPSKTLIPHDRIVPTSEASELLYHCHLSLFLTWVGTKTTRSLFKRIVCQDDVSCILFYCLKHFNLPWPHQRLHSKAPKWAEHGYEESKAFYFVLFQWIQVPKASHINLSSTLATN